MATRKFWDIDHPPVVVLAGEAERRGALRRRLRSATDYRVETVDESAAMLDRLEDRPLVECLWIGATRTDDAELDRLEAAAERSPGTSVVYAPTDGSERAAARSTAAGATEYCPASASLDEHVERIERAVGRAIDRHHDAEKRSVLDSLFAEIDASLYVKDDRARHVLLSRETGLDSDTVFGKTDPEVYQNVDEIRESYRDDLRVIETAEPLAWTVERFAEDDNWMRSTKVPWTDGERTRGLVGVTLSITDLKRKERDLLRKVGQLQDVPDYLAHDLRNPLAVAKGYLEMATAGDESALEEVAASLDRLEELIDDFHSLATRDLAGEDTLEQLQFAPLVEDTWKYVAADESTLELEVPPDATIVADESHLRPLLKNLLGNAVTHAGPDVTVEVGLLEGGFYVEDDGPGIPEADREAVFDHEFTTASEGTGIGLSIVREAAHSHGWQVSVVDGDGAGDGARFRIDRCLIGASSELPPTDAAYDLTESIDVGDVARPGAAVGGDGTYTVTGAGRNMWMHINEFHFLYATVADGVRIQARIADVERASEWSKAGVMVRSGPEEDAAYGFVGQIADRCPELGWRTRPGENATTRPLEQLPTTYDRVRLDRIGDELTTSISMDGERWFLVDQRTIALDDPVSVGLFACSVADEPIEARFEDVSVVGLSTE